MYVQLSRFNVKKNADKNWITFDLIQNVVMQFGSDTKADKHACKYRYFEYQTTLFSIFQTDDINKSETHSPRFTCSTQPTHSESYKDSTSTVDT